jgi:non-homologous end joining protein Ku
MDELQGFVGETMEISIEDTEGGDQAPKIKKTIKKIQFCPDHTHVRFYFDSIYFLAVPLNSKVNQSEAMFSASDLVSGLTYTFNKV